MNPRRKFRTGLATLLAATLACPPARALVALNDGRDRIFVTASFGVSHDSNVFANSDHEGDYVYSSGLVAEYTRRAGWIGVNGSVGVNGSYFDRNSDQNFSNPRYSLEFTKQSGRTTGSIMFNGARESRADAAVNLRSTSWNYGTGLNVKYPAGINTFIGNFGYSSRVYVDDTIFADLATYTAGLDLIHILPAERELLAGYRYRFSETSHRTSTSDHSATLGIQGRLIRGVVGSIRGGLQTRVPHGGLPGLGRFTSWTMSGSSSYAFSKRLNFAVQVAKDFSTTATDASVDATSADVTAAYAMNSKVSLSFAGGWGATRFLGDNGRVVLDAGPPIVLGGQRNDTYANWSAGLSLGLNDHLRSGINYTWFQNWSTASFADFVRRSWNLNLSSRW
jgi:hypothetical protein